MQHTDTQTRKYFSGAGRKRSAGLREPNGRLSRAVKKEIDAKSSNEIRRLRDASMLGMRDPLWGTELGRLLLARKIEPEQFEAGRRWAGLVDAWRRQHVGPQISPKGCLSNLIVSGEGDPDDLRLRGPGRQFRPSDDPEAVARAVELGAQMKAAFNVVRDLGGGVLPIVQGCCEMSQAVVLGADLDHLHTGLSALVAHWKIA